jgi:hypothetical protein
LLSLCGDGLAGQNPGSAKFRYGLRQVSLVIRGRLGVVSELYCMDWCNCCEPPPPKVGRRSHMHSSPPPLQMREWGFQTL